MKRLWFLLLVLAAVLFLTVPAGATQIPDESPSETVSTEVVELDTQGPTELEYLESINTYAMYLFAFGVFWICLTLCSLVYKLLRIFI